MFSKRDIFRAWVEIFPNYRYIRHAINFSRIPAFRSVIFEKGTQLNLAKHTLELRNSLVGRLGHCKQLAEASGHRNIEIFT